MCLFSVHRMTRVKQTFSTLIDLIGAGTGVDSILLVRDSIFYLTEALLQD